MILKIKPRFCDSSDVTSGTSANNILDRAGCKSSDDSPTTATDRCYYSTISTRSTATTTSTTTASPATDYGSATTGPTPTAPSNNCEAENPLLRQLQQRFLIQAWPTAT